MSAVAPTPAPAPPEIKSIGKVAQIPLVHDSLSAIHQTLTTYTPTAYAYGQAITTSAYSLSTPIQVRLAPLIVGADGYALKGLDAAEAKFPTPFSIKTEDVVEGIKVRKDAAVSAVTSPVYYVDSSLTPIVDRIQTAVQKYGGAEPVQSTEDTTQVGRLYNLSLGLGTHVYQLTAEQLKAIQAHHHFIQAAMERIHALNANLASSYDAARGKSVDLVNETKSQAHIYTDHILAEIDKLQTATIALPANLQTKLAPIQESLHTTFAEISLIVKAPDMPASEKVTKVGGAVQVKVQPLLAQATVTLQAYIDQAKAYFAKAAKEGEEAAAPVVNGDAQTPAPTAAAA